VKHAALSGIRTRASAYAEPALRAGRPRRSTAFEINAWNSTESDFQFERKDSEFAPVEGERLSNLRAGADTWPRDRLAKRLAGLLDSSHHVERLLNPQHVAWPEACLLVPSVGGWPGRRELAAGLAPIRESLNGIYEALDVHGLCAGKAFRWLPPESVSNVEAIFYWWPAPNGQSWGNRRSPGFVRARHRWSTKIIDDGWTFPAIGGGYRRS